MQHRILPRGSSPSCALAGAVQKSRPRRPVFRVVASRSALAGLSQRVVSESGSRPVGAMAVRVVSPPGVQLVVAELVPVVLSRARLRTFAPPAIQLTLGDGV